MPTTASSSSTAINLKDSNAYIDEAKVHLNRAVMCQLRLARPTEKEMEVLRDGGVGHVLLQSYYVWRRSCLLGSTPFLCIGMILGFVDLGTMSETSKYLNAWGLFLQFLACIDTSLLFGAIVYAAVKWDAFTMSVNAVALGWLVTFIVPFIQAFFPLEMILQDSVVDSMDYGTIVGNKIQMALSYALTLLPVLITFPGGAVRASVRIRWLLQHSSLAGWILVLCAPFFSIVLCVSLVLVMQLVGNIVLLVGMLLIVCFPWLYVVRSKLFVGVWDDEAKEQVQHTQRIIGIGSLVGFALIVVWMFTAEVAGVGVVGNSSTETDYNGYGKSYLLSYGQAFRMILDTVGRLVVTTVLFCDMILRMSVTNWRDDNERRRLIGADDVNDGFQEFIDAFEMKTTSESKRDHALGNDGTNYSDTRDADEEGGSCNKQPATAKSHSTQGVEAAGLAFSDTSERNKADGSVNTTEV